MLDTAVSEFHAAFGHTDPRMWIDVGVVTLLFYWVLTLINGTTAATLVRGMLILILLGFVLSNLLDLTMLGWLLRNAIPGLIIAVPVLFAPEIRRGLEQVGRAGFTLSRQTTLSPAARTADIVAIAARQIAERHWGALIVIERGTALGEYAASGTQIDALLSLELLLNVFFPNSPLHDGAVIVRGERLLAAGVVLPLAQSETTEHMGTRHRAAIGITERSDAITVVVSEETAQVSIANGGRMVRNLTQAHLRKVLSILDKSQGHSNLTLFQPRGPSDGGELAAG